MQPILPTVAAKAENPETKGQLYIQNRIPGKFISKDTVPFAHTY